MWNLKNNSNELIYKTDTDLTDWKQTMVTKGESRQGCKLGVWN